MTFASSFVLAGIRVYQRHISPYKGFRCAHAAHTGGASCSNAIADIVRANGMLDGWPQIVAQFAACRAAHHLIQSGDLGQSSVFAEPRVRGVCCCGPIPLPFRCG